MPSHPYRPYCRGAGLGGVKALKKIEAECAFVDGPAASLVKVDRSRRMLREGAGEVNDEKKQNSP
jgi:hypothetical protein